MSPLIESEAYRLGAHFSLQTVGKEPLTILGLTLELKQVILNLVRNALQAGDSRPLKLEMMLARKGDQAVVSLTDNGKGIEPHVLEDIFTIHYSTKGHGHGMDLAISRFIVTSLGGNISIHSNLDQGTTVQIEFPLKELGKNQPLDNRSVICNN